MASILRTLLLFNPQNQPLMKKVFLLLLCVVGVTTISVAQKRAEKRQANQQARLNEGVASGEVNKREANRLQKQINRNDKAIDAAEADGKVTKREKARLEHRQDKTSQREFKQKHDKNKRPN